MCVKLFHVKYHVGWILTALLHEVFAKYRLMNYTAPSGLESFLTHDEMAKHRFNDIKWKCFPKIRKEMQMKQCEAQQHQTEFIRQLQYVRICNCMKSL